MRLINAKTLELETFNDARSRPPYAILSHRWVDDQEVTFEDMQRPHRKWMPGWSKIEFCCEQARADGLQYAWADTCCIDKSSSAELSEAINSMYAWYSDAQHCYAYLNDVSKCPSDASSQMAVSVVKSVWFTRAWTLQELIAPNNVIFYDATFERLGTKTDFADRIEESTGVPNEVLRHPRCVLRYPVAVRMSWAASRDATRAEDIAYSLFGLFEVNLPLLYGEGSRAFARLQEEIIRRTHDHSIFLWDAGAIKTPSALEDREHLPLLASMPADFKTCRDIAKLEEQVDVRPYTMTNVGLQIELPLFPYHLDTYVALLDCDSNSGSERYGMLLAKEGKNASRWYRTRVEDQDVVRIAKTERLKRFLWQKMHIARHQSTMDVYSNQNQQQTVLEHPPTFFYGLKVDAPSFLMHDLEQIRPYALVAYHDWDPPKRKISTTKRHKSQLSETSLSSDSLLSPLSYKHISLFYSQKLPPVSLHEAGITHYRGAPGRRDRHPGSSVPPITHAEMEHGLQDESDQHITARCIGTFEIPAMDTGTAGVIFFDHLVHGIRAIKIGFDFHFHPVVFLATHEVDDDPQIQNWMRQWRFKHIKQFERSPYILQDRYANDEQRFWRLQPDDLRVQDALLPLPTDAPIQLQRGVYAFTSTQTTASDHLTFKPYEDQNWHVTLGLAKRTVDGLTFWELNMDKRDDVLELTVQLNEAEQGAPNISVSNYASP